jgi:hypothetical protein
MPSYCNILLLSFPLIVDVSFVLEAIMEQGPLHN